MKRNIIFLSFIKYTTLNVSDFYADLLREFIKNGDHVFVVSLIEKKCGGKDKLIHEEEYDILNVKINDYFNVGRIRKGLTLLEIENKITRAIKKYCSNIRFDLILYATPPITLVKPISYLKKRDNALTYLMLKDIFPQNAVDLCMMKKNGLLYSFFRKKEINLYKISDVIGCMSQANVDYMIKHNNYIKKERLEVCPNCIEVRNNVLTKLEKQNIRKELGLPIDKTIFVYGGNLGEPQSIPFIIECLKTQKNNNNSLFLIVGDGSQYPLLERYFKEAGQSNFMLLKRLPKERFERLVSSCDIGMIFLDHRFTIPNFPSRMLSYMQAGLPILACTDNSSDIGKTVVSGGFGWWCSSDNTDGFVKAISQAENFRKEYVYKEIKYLRKYYSSEVVFEIINKRIKQKELYGKK